MRYVATAQEMVLLQNNGARRHRFFNGVLIVGDPTLNTAGNAIDFAAKTDPGETLIRLFTTDLEGKAEGEEGVSLAQLCGMGTLNPATRGLFFEAPPIAVGATTVPATKGIWYKVLSGDVSYNGVTYKPNEIFCSDGTTTTTAGTGTFALHFYREELDNKGDRKAEFKLKHLMVGDETPDYHFYDVSGFEPRNAIGTADIGTGVGWTRP